ncbi:MAG: alpha/beta hydrolase fold domain-containing protein [Solirubrobacteraceae bacterium]|jgi:acetyl esterase/lipase
MKVSTQTWYPSGNDGHRVDRLVAELTLRFGVAQVRGRVYWPHGASAEAAAPLVLLLSDLGGISADENARIVGHLMPLKVAMVVLAVYVPGSGGPLPEPGRDYELAALEWAAEHARELDADPRQLLVAGQNVAGARAAWLAIRAAERGWPELRRQLLVDPTFTDGYPIPALAARVAPAIVITSGAPSDDGRRYARRLRSAGIEVTELPDACVAPNMTSLLGHHRDRERSETDGDTAGLRLAALTQRGMPYTTKGAR